MLKKYIPHHHHQQQHLGVLLDLTAIAAGKNGGKKILSFWRMRTWSTLTSSIFLSLSDASGSSMRPSSASRASPVSGEEDEE